jgi:hypothetical protein
MSKREHRGYGGCGWRFSWRADRLKALHDHGRAFELTEDSQLPKLPEPHTDEQNVARDHSAERS